MRTGMLIIVTALLLFALSFGGSWAYRQLNKPKTTAAAKTDEETPVEEQPVAVAAKPKSEPTPKSEPDEDAVDQRFGDPEVRRSVPPRSGELSEKHAAHVAGLADKSQVLDKREREMLQEQETFRVIFDDIRAEQVQVEKLRKETDDLIKSLHDQMKILEEQQIRLRDERASLDARDREANDRVTTIKRSEQANVKAVGSRLDNMPAESVAKLFRQMVKDNLEDSVVQFLSQMKERASAKVLDEVLKSDPALGAELAERLKRLRKPDKDDKASGAGAPAATPSP